MSRRNFLRGRVLGDAVEKLGGVIADRLSPLAAAFEPGSDGDSGRGPSARYGKCFPILRPPGAVREEDFLEGCTRCDACIGACPHGAIVHAPPRFRRAAGTPMIDPIREPCWMCPDTPCIGACDPGVLREDVPEKMGTARISPITCLAHQNSFCTVCSERCPVPGAIELSDGKPRIVEEVCTGCGVCQNVCPAPENAVLLMPLAERPPAPEEPSDEPNA